MFHSEQAPWHRLDEIFLRLKSKAKEIIRTITGNLPLIVPEAVSSAIISLTRYGLCTQDGTPTPSAPVDIYCNRGKLTAVDGEVVVVGFPASANLYDPSKRTENVYIGWNGEISSTQGMCYSEPIPVEPGSNLYWSMTFGDNTNGQQYNRFLQVYSDAQAPSSENFVGTFHIKRKSDSPQPGITERGYVGIPNNLTNAKYARISIQMNDTKVMISKDFASYVPYVEGELIKLASKNLYNPATKTDGYYIATSGSGNVGAGASYSNAIPVEYGKKYTFSGISSEAGSNNKRAVMYSTDGAPSTAIKVGSPVSVSITGANVPYSVTINVNNASAKYIRFSFNTNDTNVMCEEGDTATDYQPYFAEYAAAENLYSVGDTKDEQDIISGHVTRRCAACVYDGTQPVGENYISTTGGKDIGAIIVYPLAEPTTESVTPQQLTLAEGTNIIDATANVEPLTAKCKYQPVSALDILSALLGTRSGTEDMSIKDAKDVVNVILGDDNK